MYIKRSHMYQSNHRSIPKGILFIAYSELPFAMFYHDKIFSKTIQYHNFKCEISYRENLSFKSGPFFLKYLGGNFLSAKVWEIKVAVIGEAIVCGGSTVYRNHPQMKNCMFIKTVFVQFIS